MSTLRTAIAGALCSLLLGGCAAQIDRSPLALATRAELAPAPPTETDLRNLPKPRGKIVASVYAFRDQTGQYKAAPSNGFSTAVTQGGASLLVKALLDSGWFVPVEREGLQNLLTERKLARGANGQGPAPAELSGLLPSSVILEGGIVGYDSNVKNGGVAARYFGIGSSDLYRVDQVTVNLRAVDIRTGRVLSSVSTSKTLYSVEYDVGAFVYVSPTRILELEAGYTRNEPGELCVLEAIESAVIHLIAQGVANHAWEPASPADLKGSVLDEYLRAQSAPQPAALPEPARGYRERQPGMWP